LPPAGVAIPALARDELTAGAAALRTELDALTRDLAKMRALNSVLPDVEVLWKAVDWALRYDEFFDAKQVDLARRVLAMGRERAAQLRAGQAPWTEATGLVIRGYRSKLDGSVQPYALVIPADWKRTGVRRGGSMSCWPAATRSAPSSRSSGSMRNRRVKSFPRGHRAARVWPLLQCDQVCRRGGRL
jgi:hypothetical protein